MQPASSSANTGSGGSKSLKKWGPIGALIAIVVIVVAVVVSSGGGDDTESSVTEAPATSEAPAGSDVPSDSNPSGADTWDFPLSYVKAKETLTDAAFSAIDWGARCDTELGTIAVPDFFAVACMAPFTGDNGGATATGVTADEITIVHYQGPDNDPIINYITAAVKNDETNAQENATIEGFIKYFETYYELYGRKIKYVSYESTGLANDEVTARADAQRIVEEYKPFAVVGGPALTNAFADELAARETVCISCGGGTAEWFAERDPYLWNLDGSAEQKQVHVVEFIGKQLAGKPASHAGDALKAETRKFAVVYEASNGAESQRLADLMESRMTEVGATPDLMLPYTLDPGTIQQQASQIVAKMKAAGITTVVLSTDPVAPGDFTREATIQEYEPEWFVAAATLTDTNAFGRGYDQKQWAHAFGVTSLAVRVSPDVVGTKILYKWFTGQDAPAPMSAPVFMPGFNLLFSALQSTGPNLNAQTLGAFLKTIKTRRATTASYLTYGDQGIWDETDYNGVDDATVFWWDATATGLDENAREGTGLMKFVDGGKRYLPGEWPSEDKLFVQDGAVAIYETAPPEETPPAYPSPAG
jgi:hypothetical protein